MASSKKLYLGVDLGGTNIEAAAVKKGKILATKKLKTQAEKGSKHVVERVVKAARSVMKELDTEPDEYKALCIGAPGAVILETGVVSSAPNLDWTNVPLGKMLEKRLDLKVLVDNDVNIGVAGEYAYGAGRGSRHMVGIFVGTGIGGGIIVNGEFIYGARGAAGEIGHMVVRPHGRLCGCGKKGCVEAYASKTAILGAIQRKIKQGQTSLMPEFSDWQDDQPLSSSLIEDALDQGDKVVKEVMREAQYYLGLLTANLVNVLDPEVIVFGGGLVEQLGEKFIQPIRKTARKHYLQQRDADKIKILVSELGDHAGPVGAAVVARQRLAARKKSSR